MDRLNPSDGRERNSLTARHSVRSGARLPPSRNGGREKISLPAGSVRSGAQLPPSFGLGLQSAIRNPRSLCSSPHNFPLVNHFVPLHDMVFIELCCRKAGVMFQDADFFADLVFALDELHRIGNDLTVFL